MEFVIGGLAATSAGVITNPIEVVKHHMEISKKSQFNKEYKSFFHAGLTVAKKNGVKSLQKGLSPALGAHLVSYGIKLGTYQFGTNKGFTKNANGEVIVAKSMLTSTVGGAMGQYLSSPFYTLKAQHGLDMVARGTNKNMASYVDTMKKIYMEHGIKGFFRGATASLPKSIIGTSQLTSFAVAKEYLGHLEMFQNHPMYATVLSSAIAGLVLSIAMTPFETLLSKMYKQAITSDAKEYDGYLDCIKKIYQKEGLKPFYRGTGSVFMKLGPHTMLCLVFWEELKTVYDERENTTVPSAFPNFRFYGEKSISQSVEKVSEFLEEEGIIDTFDISWN